ncbi:MAG: hypothetical protein Q7S24_00485 [bacterium]|nr:hypothetical protein [bacterium]
MSQTSKIILAVIVTAILVGGGAYYWPARSSIKVLPLVEFTTQPTNSDYTTSSSETDVSSSVVNFTAIYDSVSISSNSFGGRLVSIDPNTEYLQKEMFNKVVFFLDGSVLDLNGKSLGATKFIGIGEPVNVTQENSILLPKAQRLIIKGFYHKEQYRPYAEVVESVK